MGLLIIVFCTVVSPLLLETFTAGLQTGIGDFGAEFGDGSVNIADKTGLQELNWKHRTASPDRILYIIYKLRL